MCMHTVTNQPVPTASPSGPVNGDPLSASLQADQDANPPQVPVTSKSKFGMLWQVVQPMLEGAAIGGLQGRSTPGGGFAAATTFYNQKRLQQLQMAELARQSSNDQFQNNLRAQEAARQNALTVHTLNQPNFQGRSVLPTAGVNSQGQKVFFRNNPETGEPEQIDGFTPIDKDKAGSFTDVPTDQGLMILDHSTGKLRPATVDDMTSGNASQSPVPQGAPRTIPGGVPAGMFAGTDQAVTPASQKAPTKFDSGSPLGMSSSSPSASPSTISASGGRSSSGVPLRPPNYSTPKPVIRASRSGAGVETDHQIDENPNSPTFGQDLGTTGIVRAPLPDRAAGRADSDRALKTTTSARVESYASTAMQSAGGDPDKAISILNGLQISDPAAAKDFQSLLPQIRSRVRERAKPGKSGKRPRLSSAEAQQMGLAPTQSSSVMGSDDEDDDQ